MPDPTEQSANVIDAAVLLREFSGAGRWVLDGFQSSTEVRHKTMWGLATVRVTLCEIEGEAEILESRAIRARLAIKVSSLDSKNTKRDNHLRSAAFFDAAAHPEIVVRIDSVQPDGGANLSVSSELEIAGIARPLTFTAEVTDVTPDAVTFRADAGINRADFGLTWNRLGMITGLASVAIVARFVRAPHGD